MISLCKITNGEPPTPDTLSNEAIVKCPRCDQTYRLGYSDNEWHRLSAWNQKAETAIKNAHRERDHGTGIDRVDVANRKTKVIFFAYQSDTRLGVLGAPQWQQKFAWGLQSEAACGLRCLLRRFVLLILPVERADFLEISGGGIFSRVRSSDL